MTAINVPTGARWPILPGRWARNTKSPDAALQNQMIEACNQVAAYRTKELFRWVGNIGKNTDGAATIIGSGGAGERIRWRFAFHTGPYTHQVWAKFYMAQQSSGGPTDCYSRLTIRDAAGATVGTADHHYGSSTAAATDTPAYFGQGAGYVSVVPDTDYYATFSDFDNARLISAMAWEVADDPATENGYLPGNFAATGPIMANDRGAILAMARNLWRRGAAQVMNWSVDGTAITTASATNTNVVDQNSTTVSASTPGFVLDMTGKARKSQTSGVPVVMRVYATIAGSFGKVILVDSSGNPVISVAPFDGSGWKSSSGFLPASEAKYDLQFSTTAGTLSLSNVSIFEYDA